MCARARAGRPGSDGWPAVRLAGCMPRPLTILHCLHSNFLAGRPTTLTCVGLHNHMVLRELVEIRQHRFATEVRAHFDRLETKSLRWINLLILGRQRHLIAHIVAQQDAIPMVTFWCVPHNRDFR